MINKNESIFENYKDVVGVKELQDMLNIGRNLAYELLNSKKILSKKIGKNFKILKKDIIKYLNQGEQ